MGYVGKITAGGTPNSVAASLFGTCDTAASTQKKHVTCADFDVTTPIAGVTVKVQFTYSNTAENPTLEVNNMAEKPIVCYGAVKPGTTAATSWMAGAVISFTYDGTNWCMNDWLNTDTNTTYGPADHSNAGLMSALDKTKLDAYDIFQTSMTAYSTGWSENKDATYADYYSNTMELLGITTDHFPIVVFSEADIEAYELASFAITSSDNHLTIYAKKKPTGNLSIPSVLFVKGVVAR